MKLFVTGGGGFLGLAIVRQLCAMGHTVVTYSRGNYPAIDQSGVTHFNGDLSDYTKLKEAMTGCEGVFHVAAMTSPWGKYEEYYLANVTGTKHVLQACRELGIRYLVYTSSASVVYDGKDTEGLNESIPYPKKFNALYPQTKAIAEQLVRAANDASLKTVSLRPHLVWGPGDYTLLPRLIERSKAGKLRIIGRAPNLVDCTYIDNAAKAHIKAFDQLLLDPSKVEGKAYFISQDMPIPMAELINRLIATAGCPPVTKHLPPAIARLTGRFIELTYRLFGISTEPVITLFLAQQLSTAHWYDISAAKRDFGYTADVTLEEGMERLRQWISNHPDLRNPMEIVKQKA